ncbi:MAG: hypothetical protein K0B81_09095 [Candidatus Cloacimonetes bacterium]|nr:hypothetical protein [Candidatus Cloacimonadota bacterium]
MQVEKDFEEFVKLLNESKVRYLIVGAYAVGFHAEPRNTGDIDIWVDSTPLNADKIIAVLHNFGFSTLGITKEDILNPDSVIQLGYPPVRIDMLTSLTGLDFDIAFKARVDANFGTTTVSLISLQDLIKNKEATGRTRDLADAELLRKYLKQDNQQ